MGGPVRERFPTGTQRRGVSAVRLSGPSGADQRCLLTLTDRDKDRNGGHSIVIRQRYCPEAVPDGVLQYRVVSDCVVVCQTVSVATRRRRHVQVISGSPSVRSVSHPTGPAGRRAESIGSHGASRAPLMAMTLGSHARGLATAVSPQLLHCAVSCD